MHQFNRIERAPFQKQVNTRDLLSNDKLIRNMEGCFIIWSLLWDREILVGPRSLPSYPLKLIELMDSDPALFKIENHSESIVTQGHQRSAIWFKWIQRSCQWKLQLKSRFSKPSCDSRKKWDKSKLLSRFNEGGRSTSISKIYHWTATS